MSTGYFEFWARTRVHCAAGAIVRLPALLTSLKARRVLLISDKGLEKVGLVARVTEILEMAERGNQLKLAGVFTDVQPDAGSECVNIATRYARSVGADAIVVLGGGSPMDVAKGVKFALAHHLEDICEALAAGFRWDVNGAPMGIAHIAIPTTAGTGSDVTSGAVILNEKTGVKGLLITPYLEPDFSILDAQVTVGLPASITADTGLDALTHAVETIVNVNANGFTNALTFQAIDLILRSLPIAVKEPGNLEARSDMLQASALACMALNNALGAAPVHNCSHALGALYHIPHGRANGVLLPAVMEELIEFYLPYSVALARAFSVPSTEPDATVRRVIARIRQLQADTRTPSHFGEFKIPASDMTRIVVAVSSDPLAVLYPISPEKISAIVGRVIGG